MAKDYPTSDAKQKKANVAADADKKTLGKWKARFSSAQAHQQPLFNAASRWFDAFYAAQDQRNIAPWRSKITDPKIASKIMGVVMKLSLYDPKPNFRPDDQYDFIKADNNEHLIQWQLRNPRFPDTIESRRYSVLVDAAVAGTGYALLPWKHETVKYKMRNKDTKGKVKFDEDKIKSVKMGYNDFIPVSFFRVFIEPGAQSFYSARYIILQDFKTIEELKQCNEEGEDGYGKYINLSELEEATGSTGNETEMFERSRNRLLSINDRSDESKNKPIEILYCFDTVTGEKVTLGNRETIIQPLEQQDYWHGKVPIAPFYIRQRAHSPFGDGLYERVERLGAANDANINHFFDQLDMSMNGMVLRREGSTLDMDNTPGGEAVYSGEKPDRWSFQAPDAQGFQQARNILSEAIEENTVSNYELGISRSSTDQTQGTKGGIIAIQDAAGDVISFFEKTYAASWKMVFQQWLSNNQQYMDHEQALRIEGSDGWYPKKITPDDIVTQGTLHAEVDVETMKPKNKDVDRALTLAWVDKQLEIVQVALKNGGKINLNWYELSKTAAESAGNIQFDRIMEPMSDSSDSPTTENRLLLQGKKLTPQPQEDHATHIQIHQELMDDSHVDQELKDDFIEPHIELHKLMKQQIEQQQQQEQEMANQQKEMQNEIDIQNNAALLNKTRGLSLQMNPNGGMQPQEGQEPQEPVGAPENTEPNEPAALPTGAPNVSSQLP